MTNATINWATVTECPASDSWNCKYCRHVNVCPLPMHGSTPAQSATETQHKEITMTIGLDELTKIIRGTGHVTSDQSWELANLVWPHLKQAVDLHQATHALLEASQELTATLQDELSLRGWQPISEAPQDGTEVLLVEWDPSEGYVREGFGSWCEYTLEDEEEPQLGWLLTEGYAIDPTHYMLVEPPVSDEVDEDGGEDEG